MLIENTLQYHDQLNPALFDDKQHMREDVRHALLKAAENFLSGLSDKIEGGKVHSVCLTGSNANYNYVPGSDMDVHIMMNIPSKMYDDYLQAKKTVWNLRFHVSVHGFPVEIYPQDDNEKIVKGSGWYDLTKDEWIQLPEHQENVDVDNPTIEEIAKKIEKQIDFALKYNIIDLNYLHNLGSKIWGLRDQQKSGEFSINNLAFKELRNRGAIDRYNAYLQQVQDKALTV